jgi:hypothetical protein
MTKYPPEGRQLDMFIPENKLPPDKPESIINEDQPITTETETNSTDTAQVNIPLNDADEDPAAQRAREWNETPPDVKARIFKKLRSMHAPQKNR